MIKEREQLPLYWEKLINALHKKYDSDIQKLNDFESCANELYSEYTAKDYILTKMPFEMLNLHPLASVLFYRKLALTKYKNDARIKSPVEGYKDSSWMERTDFCFINVRGSNKDVAETGSFMDAAAILPCIRAGSIHLAPIFESIFGVIYAQTSLKVISDEVTDHDLEKLGFDRYDQLRYFVDCCHLLDKAIGVDFTPHTAGLSRVCFDLPHLFRWVQFDSRFEQLINNEDINYQYTPERQQEMCSDIKSITNSILSKYNLSSMEDINAPRELSNTAFKEIRDMVVDKGYFSVPPHTWNGIGVPGVKSYYKEGRYPMVMTMKSIQ